MGRKPVYIVTLAIFAILQIPTALSTNIAGLLVLRFITGFFGSPALATGGASVADMYVAASSNSSDSDRLRERTNNVQMECI